VRLIALKRGRNGQSEPSLSVVAVRTRRVRLSSWSAGIFGSRAPLAILPAIWDEKYWTRKLKEAERELDAATRLTEVNAASARLMRIKAEMKALEAPKRRSSRGAPSAGASS
jgi:hypothetical protein